MEDRKLNEKESLELITSNDSETHVGIWMPVVEICFIVGVCLCVADSGCLGRGRSDTKILHGCGAFGEFPLWAIC